MSEIRQGDLVMVVRSNGCVCCAQRSLGRVFRVATLRKYRLRCDCGRITHNEPTLSAGDGGQRGYAISRLIKIDPPSIPEFSKTDEEIAA